MNLKLTRHTFSELSTIGDLEIDGVLECYTLEDTVRDVKIPKETAIPYGSYKVTLNMSNRFKKVMPLLLNVPNFEGVRIHAGNSNHDTEGCILVGMSKGLDFITDSRTAYNKLFDKMKVAFDAGEDITIYIDRSYLPKQVMA